MSYDSEREKARLRQRKLDAKKKEKRIPSRAKIREHIEKRLLVAVDEAIRHNDPKVASTCVKIAEFVEEAIKNETVVDFGSPGLPKTTRWDAEATKAEVARDISSERASCRNRRRPQESGLKTANWLERPRYFVILKRK
ncbi:MAG: hypothetical protein HC794_00495 [Nitrospiraceae bacterium]|nr:hypothetical protein [Nitrospiraceae bacterium]